MRRLREIFPCKKKRQGKKVCSSQTAFWSFFFSSLSFDLAILRAKSKKKPAHDNQNALPVSGGNLKDSKVDSRQESNTVAHELKGTTAGTTHDQITSHISDAISPGASNVEIEEADKLDDSKNFESAGAGRCGL